MCPLLRACFVLIIAGCSRDGVGQSATSPAPFQSYEITAGLACAPASGLSGCLRAHEPLADPSGGSDAIRQGRRLCLPVPADGCFVDDDGLAYALLGRDGGGFIVVETEATGGDGAVLVDAADGSRRRVDNRPLRSPQPGLFATVSYDTDAGYVPNRVAIWSDTRRNPVFELNDFPPGEGPTGIRRRGPSTWEIRSSRQPYSPAADGSDNLLVRMDGQGVWKTHYTR